MKKDGNIFSRIKANSIKLPKVFLLIVIYAFLLHFYTTMLFSEDESNFKAEIVTSNNEKIQVNNLVVNDQATFLWTWLGPIKKEKKNWYGAHLTDMYCAYLIKIPLKVLNTIKLEENTGNVIRNTVHGSIILGDGTILECNLNSDFKGLTGLGDVEMSTENILEIRFLQKADKGYKVNWKGGEMNAFLYNIDNSVIEFRDVKITNSDKNKNNVIADFHSSGIKYDIPIDKIKAIIHEKPQSVDYSDYYTQFKIVTLDDKEYIGGLGNANSFIDGAVKIGNNYIFEGSIMIKMPTFKKVEFKPTK